MFRFRPIACMVLALSLPPWAFSQGVPRSGVQSVVIDGGASGTAALAPPPRVAMQQFAVRLSDQPLVAALGANARKTGAAMGVAQRSAHMAMIRQKQDAVMAQIRTLGGVELGRVGKAYNALLVNAPSSRLAQIAALPGVTAVRPLADFETSLVKSVPYVGAATLHAAGLTGSGVKIAILDSGVDYTHRNLGGSGLAADYASASANPATLPGGGLFPSAKVVAGYDFVGDTWPNGPRTPDANPIDLQGHGTAMADMAAGRSLDGQHSGVAPGAKVYAGKVCSSVATSCNGVAIMAALDWVMDPNGDLDFSDAADVVAMALGTDFAQREQPTAEAVSNLVRFGVVVVAAAGNAGDRPYILASPGNASEAISVAETTAPDLRAFPLVVNAPASIAGSYGNTATVAWAPVVNGFSGIVRAGTPATVQNGCTLAQTPDFTGRVALLDRGGCSVSIKVDNARARGAIGVLIGLNSPGDAVTFSFGGGTAFVETLVIQQSLSQMIRAQAPDTVSATLSAGGLSLTGSMAATSARGPAYNFSTIKPDMGAPGGSVAALVGTGTGEAAVGGTSSAAAMAAGAVALLVGKFPTAVPSEIKARLMNSAQQTVYTNPATLPGVLAPITRIGAGELRVDRAAALTTGLWDATNPHNVSLAFGAPRVAANTVYSKKVAVRNYSAAPRTYTITRAFRYAADEASGAVTLGAPASLTVPANGTGAFLLTLTVDAARLPAWTLGSGAQQGRGDLLTDMEFDGYLTVSEGAERVSVPWHILPHRAANVTPASTGVALNGASTGSLQLANLATPNAGATEVFALTGTSPQATTQQPAYGSGAAMVDLKAVGVRYDAGSDALQFALATYGDRAHPAYPAGFEIDVDITNDGVPDYAIYTQEIGTFASSGQTGVYVTNLQTGTTSAYYYADADLNSSNVVMTIPFSVLGITPAQPIGFSVIAYDNYFSGSVTDSIAGMTITPGKLAYQVAPATTVVVPAGSSASIGFSKVAGGAAASPSQKGFLLMHRDAKYGRESDVVLVTP